MNPGLGASPYPDTAANWVIENLLRQPGVSTILAVLSILVTLMLWRNIWKTGAQRSILGKLGWTLVVCVPLGGWVLYGGLGTVPRSHRSIPKHWESDGMG
jgi:hypothetical protein